MYQTLFAIEYNNKKFLLFLAEDKRITFVELKDNGAVDYPEYDDFQALHEIYNNYDYTIKYAEKIPLSEKVRWKSALLTVILEGSMLVGGAKLLLNPQLETISFLANGVAHGFVVERDEIPNFFEEAVTVEDILDAIANNPGIPQKYKPIAIDVLNTNLELDPDMDLRIYYENLKRLKVKILSDYDLRYIGQKKSASAWFSPHLHEICIWKEYEDDSHLVAHEFNHAAHNLILKDKKGTIYINEKEGFSLEEAMNEVISSENQPHSYSTQVKFLKFLLKNVDNFNYHIYNKEGIPALIEELKEKYPSIDINYIISYLDALTITHNSNIKKVYHYNYKELMDELFSIAKANSKESRPYDSLLNFINMFADDIEKDWIIEYFDEYNDELEEKNIPIISSYSLFDYLNLRDINEIRKLSEKEKYNLLESIFQEIINNITKENVYNDLTYFEYLTDSIDFNNYSMIDNFYNRYDEAVAQKGYMSLEDIQLVRQINGIITTKEGKEFLTEEDNFVTATSQNGYIVIYPMGRDYIPKVITEDGTVEEKIIQDEAITLERLFSYDKNFILRRIINHPRVQEASFWYQDEKEEFIDSLTRIKNNQYNTLNGEELFSTMNKDMKVIIGIGEDHNLAFQLKDGEKTLYETTSRFISPTAEIPYYAYVSLLSKNFHPMDEYNIENILSKEFIDNIDNELLQYFCPNIVIHQTRIDNKIAYDYEFNEPETLILDGQEKNINDVYIYNLAEKSDNIYFYYYLHIKDNNDRLLGEVSDLDFHLEEFQNFPNIIYLSQLLKYYNIEPDSNNTYHLTEEEINNLVDQYFLHKGEEIIKK